MKTVTAPRIAVAVVAALLMTACGSDTEPAAESRTIELTAADTGSTLSLRTGDEVVVTLDSNATTGFAWQLTTEPAAEVLDLVKSAYVAPDTDLVGAGGQEVWRFVATGEGTTEVHLRYERSFSGETAGDAFDFTVVVQPA